MIESAMMFALGVFVSGLLALTFFGAYARRTRRVVERRLRARMAVGRAEIDAERDELRARNAVEVRRLEREIGHLRDQATASRLDGDVKEQELTGLRAEINATAADIEDYEERLDELLEQLHDEERESAEHAGGKRALQYELEREEERRAQVQEALDKTGELARERWLQVERLFAENSELRAATSRREPDQPAKILLNTDTTAAKMTDTVSGPPAAPAAPMPTSSKLLPADRPDTDQRPPAAPPATNDGHAAVSRVPEQQADRPDPRRAVPPAPVGSIAAAVAKFETAAEAIGKPADAAGQDTAPPDSDDQIAATDPANQATANTTDDAAAQSAQVNKIASELHRIAGETASGLFKRFRRNKPVTASGTETPDGDAVDQQNSPAQNSKSADAPDIADLSRTRIARKTSGMPGRAASVAAEAQLMSAVEEIRALKDTGTTKRPPPAPARKAPADQAETHDAPAGE